MSTIEIRHAQEEDFPALVEIKLAAEAASMPFKKFRRTEVEELAYMKETAQRCTLLVATDSGRILGFTAYDPTWMEQLFVLPEHYRQGIGSLLLNHVKKLVDVIHISVIRENTQALDFYKKHGFTFIEDIPNSNGAHYVWERPVYDVAPSN